MMMMMIKILQKLGERTAYIVRKSHDCYKIVLRLFESRAPEHRGQLTEENDRYEAALS